MHAAANQCTGNDGHPYDAPWGGSAYSGLAGNSHHGCSGVAVVDRSSQPLGDLPMSTNKSIDVLELRRDWSHHPAASHADEPGYGDMTELAAEQELQA